MLNLRPMGVINLTPNSFSDGQEISSPKILEDKLKHFNSTVILDFGAESTAPMNEPISADEELARFGPYLDIIFSCDKLVSIDTYQPETIFFFQKEWLKRGLKTTLVWNDVSGKFDDEVKKFLNEGSRFHYVFCHNLAPTRDLSARHMDYTIQEQGEDFLNHLQCFFKKASHERVILDPCLGFSKTFEQNWYTLENIPKLQQQFSHSRFLIGFSRKSFLRSKYQLSRERSDRDLLDFYHCEEVKRLSVNWQGEVWLRTHRPELL